MADCNNFKVSSPPPHQLECQRPFPLLRCHWMLCFLGSWWRCPRSGRADDLYLWKRSRYLGLLTLDLLRKLVWHPVSTFPVSTLWPHETNTIIVKSFVFGLHSGLEPELSELSLISSRFGSTAPKYCASDCTQG